MKSYSDFDKVVYHLEDITQSSVSAKKEYQKLLLASEFSKYLVKDGEWCYYEITPNTNWSRNLTMVSIIRYLEEASKGVAAMLKDIAEDYTHPTAKLLSVPFYAGIYSNSNHWVGQPWHNFMGKTVEGGEGMDNLRLILKKRNDLTVPKCILGARHYYMPSEEEEKWSEISHPWTMLIDPEFIEQDTNDYDEQESIP